MKHAGRIISHKVKESGISISHVARYLKVQRTTVYNLFEKEMWPIHRLREMESLLHLDLSDLYPKEIPNKEDTYFLTPDQARVLMEEREEFRRLYLEAIDQINLIKAAFFT
jgi:predicted transcriptional regulator